VAATGLAGHEAGGRYSVVAANEPCIDGALGEALLGTKRNEQPNLAPSRVTGGIGLFGREP
jgi:hypothetical protein